MTIRNVINSWAWRLIDWYSSVPIYRDLPFGCNLYYDIKKWLPEFRAEVVFDVGANIGQSAEVYLKQWPKAEIHCFEPVQSTYEQLQLKIGHLSNVNLHRLAMSEREGVASMIVDERSTMSSLKMENAVTEGSVQEEVPLTTLDEFCKSNGITRISFLKIDTEGSDLDVLRGGDLMLRSGAVDLVQVEAGMYRGNQKHESVEGIKQHLEERGYLLFAIYDQHLEKIYRRPILRRANPVFISERLAQEFGAFLARNSHSEDGI